ncbi:MAG: hypothetical protein K2I53_13280, partial [Lachnospiraceae bacterium]|nr:hypothetical protein [Lachnospiraceae bacterium]
MARTDFILHTDRVPILNEMGVQIDEAPLPEMITPVPRRRCGISESHTYYKGAGIIYQGHFANQCDGRMIRLSENPVAYQRYSVAYPGLYQKYGIFTFCHQPIFTDYEGGCGPKEENLTAMQERSGLSAIQEIVDVLETPLENHKIYAFRLKELQGSYKDTVNLIEYILSENFNSAWDKNLWADIMCYGYVRDLADWFISDRPAHRLGTIYALLHSVMKADKCLYEEIVHETVGLEQMGDIYMPYVAAGIVERYVPGSLGGISGEALTPELMGRLWGMIYSGKACCHLENEEAWAHVRANFMREIPRQTAMVRPALALARRCWWCGCCPLYVF